jgi:hypothetical protein
MSDTIADEVLKQIADGNGHCYRHEAKQMARELLEFRKQRDALAKMPTPSYYGGGIP